MKFTSLPFFAAMAAAATISCSSSSAHKEVDGYVCFESDAFSMQELCEVRKWEVMTPDISSESAELCQSASENKYIQLLPDTRKTHSDEFLAGENFTDVAGQMAVLSYDVEFTTPGRYYVWVSLYSTGSEDNGLHVGLDGMWPKSGNKMQWCVGKNSWRWESKQRTEQAHCGVPYQIYLDVKEAGVHQFMISMREDGVKIDQIALSLDKDYAPNKE